MPVNVNEAGGYITTGRIQNILFRKVPGNLNMCSHFRNFSIFYYQIAIKRFLLFSIYDPSIFNNVIHFLLSFLNFPDKLANALVFRMIKKFFRRRILHNNSIFHKQNPVCYLSGPGQ